MGRQAVFSTAFLHAGKLECGTHQRQRTVKQPLAQRLRAAVQHPAPLRMRFAGAARPDDGFAVKAEQHVADKFFLFFRRPEPYSGCTDAQVQQFHGEIEAQAAQCGGQRRGLQQCRHLFAVAERYGFGNVGLPEKGRNLVSGHDSCVCGKTVFGFILRPSETLYKMFQTASSIYFVFTTQSLSASPQY